MANTEQDTEDEGETLLEQSTTKEVKPSRSKQKGMLITVLFLQFCSLCADTIIYPFFPSIAKEKGLNNSEIGGIFSAYELSRCVTSPIFGSLVR